MRASVVVPVKDGARYLDEVLAAVQREAPDEVLVIDSGSRDGSVEIARSFGVHLVEIPSSEFGHGRTRNLAFDHCSGDLVCFLTQDATPVAGWLKAYAQVFETHDRVGAAYGPHLPRRHTSPMIARELTEFFRGFSADGQVALQGPGDEPFLSNVNACYRRTCWADVRFRDVSYAEDQAFGRDLLAAGWLKAYCPDAAALHAHDFGAVAFMRRYFDEYRGLYLTAGYVEPFGVRSTVRDVRSMIRSDVAYMKDAGYSSASRAKWTFRAAKHHSGRKVAAALGGRGHRLPRRLQRRLSLEGTAEGPTHASSADDGDALSRSATVAASSSVAASRSHHEYESVAEVLMSGPAPLEDPVGGMSTRASLHFAIVIPPFQVGSGGHNTVFQITSRLEQMGHTCSIWLDDPFGVQAGDWPGAIRQTIRDHFAPVQAPVFKGFDHWFGADVAMATGWQTVYPTLLLDSCRARAYMVNDNESEFYPTSIESFAAAQSYRYGLHCIAASPWLRDLVSERYGASATDFQLGVDPNIYRPQDIERDRDTVVFYARSVTPRRAVPLGVLALTELKRRRPSTRIVMYGDNQPLPAPFDYEHLGIAPPPELARLYSSATAGLCLSMTNFSLVPKEMLACGLPCVELAGISAESIFGDDGGPLELAAPNPGEIADALERLLDDPYRWEQASREGAELVASHTWEVAAEQTEAGLRHALRIREFMTAGVPA